MRSARHRRDYALRGSISSIRLRNGSNTKARAWLSSASSSITSAPAARQRGDQIGEPVDQEGGMRLARRPELVLDAEMQADVAACEPAAAAAHEARRLWHLRKAQHPAIEVACGILLAARYRDLDMLDGMEPPAHLSHHRLPAGAPAPVLREVIGMPVGPAGAPAFDGLSACTFVSQCANSSHHTA
jgi:hypothetical protein